MKILIIDDEGNLRRMLRALLEAGRVRRWRKRRRGHRGLALVESFQPEVVLLDLVLPGETRASSSCRGSLSARPALPVIMMSGEATLADAMEATRMGAFHFLEKPLTPEAVLMTLQGALEVSRARDL
jgi:two-component system, NtrC family, nitrogen regulation response regulator NtrX